MKLTPEDISALQRFVPDCKKSGMKLDQIDRFVNAGYFPHSRQQLFHAACRDADTGFVKEILVGGGRGGGKSHACVAQAGIDDCQRYSNLKVLFLRKVQKAAKESFNDLTRRVLKDIPKEVRQLEVRFPNGSFIIFGGFRNSGDIEKYVGIEYDLIIIEELTLLTLDVYQKLLGSLRTSRQDGYVPRLYASTNPGSIGHSWVKQRFVVPHRLGIEGKYDNGDLVKTRFISSLAQDNPFLDQGYKKDILEKLTGNLRKMWLEGSWELNEGAAFDFNYQRHTVEDYEFDSTWTEIRGIDDGYAKPYCCLWGVVNPAIGRVYIFREDYVTHKTNAEQAERIILKQEDGEEELIHNSYADPHMFVKSTTDIATSGYDIYKSKGILLSKGNNDRIAGKRKIDNLLSLRPDGLPGLLIKRTCGNLIRELESLIFDEHQPEDVQTTDGDHAYDALRYMLTNFRDPHFMQVANSEEYSYNKYKTMVKYFK